MRVTFLESRGSLFASSQVKLTKGIQTPAKKLLSQFQTFNTPSANWSWLGQITMRQYDKIEHQELCIKYTVVKQGHTKGIKTISIFLLAVEPCNFLQFWYQNGVNYLFLMVKSIKVISGFISRVTKKTARLCIVIHCCMKCPQIVREKTSSQNSQGIALRIQWYFFHQN